MKSRYRLVCRGSRGGKFYCYDTRLRQRTSLNTTDRRAAVQIVNAKNQAEQQPALNLQLAKAYLAGTDNGITKRTWADALAALTAMKRPANRARWERAAKDKAYVPLLPLIITETPAELMLKVLQTGTVSTNIYLRRLHNFCVDMNWLPWPLVPKRQWPAVRFKEKHAPSPRTSTLKLWSVNEIPSERRSINFPGTWALRNRTWPICRPRTSTGLRVSFASCG